MLEKSIKKGFLDLIKRDFKNDDLYVINAHFEKNIPFNRASLGFWNWIKLLRERYGDFKYMGVCFFNQKGVYSFHLVTNISGIPQDELKRNYSRKIWGRGNVHIKKIDNLYDFYEDSHLSKHSKEFIWKA